MMPVHDFLSILGIGLALVAGGLYFLPVGVCKECPHCIADKQRRKDEALRKEHTMMGHLCHAKCPLYNPRPKR